MEVASDVDKNQGGFTSVDQFVSVKPFGSTEHITVNDTFVDGGQIVVHVDSLEPLARVLLALKARRPEKEKPAKA